MTPRDERRAEWFERLMGIAFCVLVLLIAAGLFE